MSISKIKLVVFIFFLVTMCSCDFVTCYAQEKIIAIVNDDVITQRDVNEFSNYMRMQLSGQYKGKELDDKVKEMKTEILDRLLEDRIILQEAKKSGIVIDESRVKAKVGEIKGRYPSDAHFQRSLEMQGMTQADLESRIREQMLMYVIVEAKVRSKIVVNPTEVTEFYQNNPQEFKSSQVWQFDTLSLDTQDKANVISKALKSGQDILEVAAGNSLKVEKMDVSEGHLKKELEDVVLKLKVGEVSDPILIGSSYYVFKLTNILAAQAQGLDQAQDKIYTFLSNKKMQLQLTKWIDELKKQSYIKIIQN